MSLILRLLSTEDFLYDGPIPLTIRLQNDTNGSVFLREVTTMNQEKRSVSLFLALIEQRQPKKKGDPEATATKLRISRADLDRDIERFKIEPETCTHGTK